MHGVRKGWSFQLVGLGQLDIHLEIYLILHIKINSRCIIGPNIKGKTIKHLEDKKGEYFYDHKQNHKGKKVTNYTMIISRMSVFQRRH